MEKAPDEAVKTFQPHWKDLSKLSRFHGHFLMGHICPNLEVVALERRPGLTGRSSDGSDELSSGQLFTIMIPPSIKLVFDDLNPFHARPDSPLSSVVATDLHLSTAPCFHHRILLRRHPAAAEIGHIHHDNL